ncbi:neurogenic locus Notch protein-like isoform X3 [Saccostrea cucullata]|uniref:neurogenic locus Notch protein-like isoform X3 n=1 Tax=Saccostrea cuccullata TaxID=36930 RepID=UPI002ED0E3AB
MFFLYCSMILGVLKSCICVSDTERYMYGQSKMHKSQSSFVRDSLQYTYPRGSLAHSLAADDQSSPAILVGDGSHGIPIGYNKTYRNVYVSSNGQIVFGQESHSLHPERIYKGPDMLAPYWTDLYPTGGDNGYVFYTTYSADNPLDHVVISKANFAVLYNSGNSGFSAKWVLVVTWWNTRIVDFIEDRITIQCVVMTDFITTYTIYNYMDVDVDPSQTSRQVAIEYKTNLASFRNENSFKANAFNLTKVRGNTGEYGIWFYTLADDNDCKWKLCQNGGSCIEKYGGYQCSCYPGFTGINCENDINECLDSPCSNGTCENNPGSYICGCDLGFTGELCDQDINECNSTIIPCKNGASCFNDIGSFNCTCAPGWNGTFCDQDINECEEEPCLYGTCVNTAGSYYCNCRAGIGGQLCDEDVNECVNAHPCENNGTCVNTLGTFKCTCTLGYVGLTCSYENNKIVADTISLS